MLLIRPVIALLCWVGLVVPVVADDLSYVGNASCGECHAEQMQLWQGSHHAKAMQAATSKTVLGDFNQTRFEGAGGWTEFNQDEKGYYLTTGPLGQAGKRFEVPYVFGYYPLQQVLVDIGQGRLQAYTVAWDARPKDEGGQRWYSLYQDTHSHASPFYWQGQFNNWNARCAQCHSTDLQRGYDVATDSYHTQWSEINVSCEACHGKASNHVKLKQANKEAVNSGFAKAQFKQGLWAFSPDQLTAKLVGSKPATIEHGQPGQCIACHSRRVAITDGNDPSQFNQDYIPRLALPDLYHSDGQILDEVYIYGSFSQSKMAAAGVVCSDCHDPHSAKVKMLDNNLCAQCHLPTEYDTPKHTLHEADSTGGVCIDCHMPSQRYMGVDDRRDHSFKVPNPWVSEALDTPDVCLNCHQDKDSAWSQQILKDKKAKVFGHYDDIGSALLLAQTDAIKGQAHLAQLIKDEQQPPMRRAVLLSHLDLSSVSHLEVLHSAANSEQTLVKLGVISALESAPSNVQVQIGFGLLYDQDKNVRMQAMRLLAPLFRREVPAKAQQKLQQVVTEAITTYQGQQDLLSAQLALADIAYKVGQLPQAQLHYENALQLQPQFLPAKLNLASILREQGQLALASQLLNDILSIEPEHAMALHNLGLVYTIEKRWSQALPALAKAAQLEPQHPRFGFVYLLALEAAGEITTAQEQLARLQALTPDDPALQKVKQRLSHAAP
ncbi:ammonia-forming cytochrome c nitrite reductase subunit c552 [Motilimonas pumila]|uniref:Ammonia-forming cytochrome c nitrite reductase subunit c552 n=1 Tax=Motilimonas pumila TaxID=2303987 RepID=A0A418YHV6_9GAMM|nr:ammonia-forming cytochrome c nitrite reductase subunit c552 [Motilimonas pumila]RJG49917.1 ammonia-forming cytochrome c nitrite reductase subunit c552 [Motilimonas pumila]